MQAVHFGAGNIGRGFIGEVLFKNGFSIDFVDIDSRIIEALQSRQEYEVDYAQDHAIPFKLIRFLELIMLSIPKKWLKL